MDGWARGASARRTRRDLLRFAGIGGAAAAVAACTPPPSAPARCDEGQTTCSDTCVDLQTNNAHCGLCGTSCGAGHVCTAGVCTTVCTGGQVNCAGVCRDISTDSSNCGSCGHMCGVGETCSGGICSCTSPGFTNCGGFCVDLNTTSNCGGCGVTCPAGPNSSATCTAGHCGLTCNPGFADCDGTGFDGCEVNLMTDERNCGGCGVVCPTPQNSVGICAGGHCSIVCSPGYRDCDGSPTTGCEVFTDSDPHNCGGCGMTCLPGQVCSSGVCVGCSSNADCTGGLVCRGGTCSSCATDGDCSAGQTCHSGLCS